MKKREMSAISEKENYSNSSSSHSQGDMAHIYVIDCGVNDSRYNVSTKDNEQNDNIEFKLRVERNKQKPEETLVNGHDLEEVIKNTLIPTVTTSPLTSSSSLTSSTSLTSPHTRCESCKMQYVLQFANGKIVLPDEMLRDGDTVEVHRYFLQRSVSTKDKKKTTEREQQEESVLEHYGGSEAQEIRNNELETNKHNKRNNAKSVIVMSDESDNEDDNKNFYCDAKTEGKSSSMSSSDNDSDYGGSTCANSKQMHTAKYIDALRQELAIARNNAQELDDEVENEKRVLREQVMRARDAIKHDAEEQLHSLHEQLANLESEAVRIKAMQNRTRCATKRILDKMKDAQRSIDQDIVLLDNEMDKMLRTWQKCVDAYLRSKYKQTSKVSNKDHKVHELLTNERAELEAEGVILCRELIASVAHACVSQMRQKMQHEWNNTREMETEQVGETSSHPYSALSEIEQNNSNSSNINYSTEPLTAHETNIVKVVARLRPPCSFEHIVRQNTKLRKQTKSRQGNKILNDVKNNKNDNVSVTRKVDKENDEVKHKWNAVWRDMQSNNEYSSFVNETSASIQVRVPTKGVRTFTLNAVYGPIPTNTSYQKETNGSICLSNEHSKSDTYDDEQQSCKTHFTEVQEKKQEEEQQQQKRIFAEQLLPLILELLFCANKRFVTVIAYGAKGSGKSYTLLGNFTNASEQCHDNIEKNNKEYMDEDAAHSNSSTNDNHLHACEEIGNKEATQRGITSVDANWVVNMNENAQARTSRHKEENTNVSAYSTAWQSVAQSTIDSRKTMSMFKEQISKQLESNTLNSSCSRSTDGLLPQTLQFLVANLRSNRQRSTSLDHKYEIVEIGVSVWTIDQTGVHDLFAKLTRNNNNVRHQQEETHKINKDLDTFYSSSYSSLPSSPLLKPFITKVNKQNISLESVNVTSINDISTIMKTLKSVEGKCNRRESSILCKGEHTKIDASKGDSYTSSKDEMQNNESTQSSTQKAPIEKESGNTSYENANGNHHLLIVVRCILSTHHNAKGKHAEQYNIQHSESVDEDNNNNITICKGDQGNTEAKEVQMLFVEVAAGSESNHYISNNSSSNDGVLKRINKQQTTRTLTSIGNVLYALNHGTSLNEKERQLLEGETKETCYNGNNNTSLSLIKWKTQCASLSNESIFDEDPGKWWDVLQPFHGMTFTRVAPIIQQTQDFVYDGDSDNNNNTIETTPFVSWNAQQRTASSNSTPFVHNIKAQSNDSSKNVAHNLSATQRSILAQGYANDTLTQLIRDGLTGNSRVLLMACLKPCVPCEVSLVTEDAKPLTLPNPHTVKAIEQIREIITLLFNIQAPQMLA